MRRTALVLFPVALLLSVAIGAQQPELPQDQRTKILTMLSDMHSQIAEHYYDEKLHGLNWDQRYEQYKERVQGAKSVQEGLRVVAAFVAGLKDSHTFFEPPPLAVREDYGYAIQMFGDRCFITGLRPSSDAAAKLNPGDEVLHLNGYSINRQDLWQLSYVLNLIEPVLVTRFEKRSPDGKVEQVDVNSTETHNQRLGDATYNGSEGTNFMLEAERERHELRQRHTEINDVMVWKMPAFVTTERDLDSTLSIAHKHQSLILDLRGNPGGEVELLERSLGSFVPVGTEIAKRVGRKTMKPVVTRKFGDLFQGNLIVLVDSGSASAAELFSRTIQLNHRGTIIGDHTSGSVMEAVYYPMSSGLGVVTVFGASITDADLIMPDGQSLENHGVTPDEIVLPTGADLADGRDPVLAYALGKFGVKMDAKAAGTLFPLEWRPLKLK